MRLPSTNGKLIGVLVVLAITQVIGWGTVGLPAVVGRQIAADLQMNISAVFAGTSVLYVVMGLWAPVLAKAFTRCGAKSVMIAGTLVAVPGFVLLSLSQGTITYFAAWVILGTAGSATLTTAAYILLNEIEGRNAKGAIGALMLVTGLSSSIFWPTTSFLSDAFGWRLTCLTYAAATFFICLPLHVFGLPRRVRASDEKPAMEASTTNVPAIAEKTTFYLIVSAIGLNAFVTYGFSAILIELLKAEGLSAQQAIGFGASLGVIQVSARGIDFLGGGRWDGITTGLFAGIALPVAMLMLMTGGGSYWSIAAFLLLYGLGSGALAVARATIPLVFYDKAAYARAASHIALPLNLMSALSPPILVALLIHLGSSTLLWLAIACSCGALFILLLLRRRRSAPVPAAAI